MHRRISHHSLPTCAHSIARRSLEAALEVLKCALAARLSDRQKQHEFIIDRASLALQGSANAVILSGSGRICQSF